MLHAYGSPPLSPLCEPSLDDWGSGFSAEPPRSPGLYPDSQPENQLGLYRNDSQADAVDDVNGSHSNLSALLDRAAEPGVIASIAAELPTLAPPKHPPTSAWEEVRHERPNLDNGGALGAAWHKEQQAAAAKAAADKQAAEKQAEAERAAQCLSNPMRNTAGCTWAQIDQGTAPNGWMPHHGEQARAIAKQKEVAEKRAHLEAVLQEAERQRQEKRRREQQAAQRAAAEAAERRQAEHSESESDSDSVSGDPDYAPPVLARPVLAQRAPPTAPRAAAALVRANKAQARQGQARARVQAQARAAQPIELVAVMVPNDATQAAAQLNALSLQAFAGSSVLDAQRVASALPKPKSKAKATPIQKKKKASRKGKPAAAPKKKKPSEIDAESAYNTILAAGPKPASPSAWTCAGDSEMKRLGITNKTDVKARIARVAPDLAEDTINQYATGIFGALGTFKTDKYSDVATFRTFWNEFESPDPSRTKRIAFADFLAANTYPALGDTKLEQQGTKHKGYTNWCSGFDRVLDDFLDAAA